jgi:hypothetical protein
MPSATPNSALGRRLDHGDRGAGAFGWDRDVGFWAAELEPMRLMEHNEELRTFLVGSSAMRL